MSEIALETRTRSRVWTGAIVPFGVLLVALGAWVVVAPLVGPSFGFAFDTDTTWRFSENHILLMLLPGLAILAGGVLMLVPRNSAGWLGGMLAVAGGVWLVIGPTLHATWSPHPFAPTPGTAWHGAARWICDVYGPGVLAIYLGGHVQGLLERRTERVVEQRPPVIDEEEEVDQPTVVRAMD